MSAEHHVVDVPPLMSHTINLVLGEDHATRDSFRKSGSQRSTGEAPERCRGCHQRCDLLRRRSDCGPAPHHSLGRH